MRETFPPTPPFNSRLRDPWGPQWWWSPLEKQLNIHDCIVHQLPTIQYNVYIQGLHCPQAPSSPTPAESIRHFEFRNGNQGVANFPKSDRPECPTNVNSIWQRAVSVLYCQKRSKMYVKCFMCWSYWFYFISIFVFSFLGLRGPLVLPSVPPACPSVCQCHTSRSLKGILCCMNQQKTTQTSPLTPWDPLGLASLDP